MRLRMIDCIGGGRDNPHSYSVEGDQTPRCSACHDTASTEDRDGKTWSFNVWQKVVDKKPLRAEGEVRRAYAAGAGVAPMGLGMTRSGIKI